MASYNGEQYISEQIESIIRCIDLEDELIISDDGSTDSTVDIINRFCSQFSNIKLVQGPKKGVVANFQHALFLAKGDIIFLADQDDVWEPNKVSEIMYYFKRYNKVTTIVHNAAILDQSINQEVSTLFEFRNSGSGLLKNLIKNSYVGCCMAFRKELLDIAMPFPERIAMHDWWLGLCSEVFGTSLFIEDELIKYRRHGNNVSQMKHGTVASMLLARIKLISNLFHRIIK